MINKDMLKRILIFLSFLILVSACEQTSKSDFVPQYERSGVNIRIKVYLYDTIKDLNRGVEARAREQGLSPTPETKEGWSGWNTAEPYYCEIHVLRLKYLQDPQMETWGHELAHCIYGSYHPEGKR